MKLKLSVKTCRPVIQRYFNTLSGSNGTSHNVWLPTPSSSGSGLVQNWDRALSDAEKVVGYSTSYFSLRCLLSEEISNVALHLRKLVGTDHPLLETAKRLTVSGNSTMQTRGLVVLLVSKAAGHVKDSIDSMDAERSTGISQRQRSLAEMTEMIYSAHLIHRGILNLYPGSFLADSEKIAATFNHHQELQFGNKMSVLSGDFLLATVWKGLGELKNTKVVELMAKSISDFMEGQFIIETESKLPEDNIDPEYWVQRNFRMYGSLQANSCQSSVVLAGHDSLAQTKAYGFGKNFALAWQALQEMQVFLGPPPSSSSSSSSSPSKPENHQAIRPSFDLMSAPILLHIAETGKNLDSVTIGTGDDGRPIVDYEKLYHLIKSGPGLQLTRELKNRFAQDAHSALNGLPVNDAVKALANILYAVKAQ